MITSRQYLRVRDFEVITDCSIIFVALVMLLRHELFGHHYSVSVWGVGNRILLTIGPAWVPISKFQLRLVRGSSVPVIYTPMASFLISSSSFGFSIKRPFGITISRKSRDSRSSSYMPMRQWSVPHSSSKQSANATSSTRLANILQWANIKWFVWDQSTLSRKFWYPGSAEGSHSCVLGNLRSKLYVHAPTRISYAINQLQVRLMLQLAAYWTHYMNC